MLVELWRAIKLDKGIFAVSRSIASDISVRDKLQLAEGRRRDRVCFSV